jgi:hypothetical protein
MHRPSIVLLRTGWVLRSRYDLGKDEILSVFSELRNSVDLAFEDDRP